MQCTGNLAMGTLIIGRLWKQKKGIARQHVANKKKNGETGNRTPDLLKFPLTVANLQMRCFFFFFKESLIAFILSRIWRWTAAPGVPGGFSLPLRPVPAPPYHYVQFYKMKSATASHHFSSSHSESLRLPFPSPTHGHSIRCAAFCGVHPSHTFFFNFF